MMRNSIRSIFAAFIFLSAAVSSAVAQGTLTGKVLFEGTPPVSEQVDVKSDVPVCGTHKEVAKLTLGADKGVADAVVRILDIPGAPAAKDGHLDQVGCQFVPHVQVIPLDSTLVITSSDSVLHNAHGFYEDGSTAFNIAVPIVGMEMKKKLKKPGVIKLRCDAGHTWMSGYIIVADNPYYAVTGADGQFTIEGIPPGDHEIEIWQEWLGKTVRKVSIKDGSNEFSVVLKKD